MNWWSDRSTLARRVGGDSLLSSRLQPRILEKELIRARAAVGNNDATDL